MRPCCCFQDKTNHVRPCFSIIMNQKAVPLTVNHVIPLLNSQLNCIGLFGFLFKAGFLTYPLVVVSYFILINKLNKDAATIFWFENVYCKLFLDFCIDTRQRDKKWNEKTKRDMLFWRRICTGLYDFNHGDCLCCDFGCVFFADMFLLSSVEFRQVVQWSQQVVDENEGPKSLLDLLPEQDDCVLFRWSWPLPLHLFLSSHRSCYPSTFANWKAALSFARARPHDGHQRQS